MLFVSGGIPAQLYSSASGLQGKVLKLGPGCLVLYSAAGRDGLPFLKGMYCIRTSISYSVIVISSVICISYSMKNICAPFLCSRVLQ